MKDELPDRVHRSGWPPRGLLVCHVAKKIAQRWPVPLRTGDGPNDLIGEAGGIGHGRLPRRSIETKTTRRRTESRRVERRRIRTGCRGDTIDRFDGGIPATLAR